MGRIRGGVGACWQEVGRGAGDRTGGSGEGRRRDDWQAIIWWASDWTASIWRAEWWRQWWDGESAGETPNQQERLHQQELEDKVQHDTRLGRLTPDGGWTGACWQETGQGKNPQNGQREKDPVPSNECTSDGLRQLVPQPAAEIASSYPDASRSGCISRCSCLHWHRPGAHLSAAGLSGNPSSDMGRAAQTSGSSRSKDSSIYPIWLITIFHIWLNDQFKNVSTTVLAIWGTTLPLWSNRGTSQRTCSLCTLCGGS